MDHEYVLWFGILKDKVLVEHSKRVVGNEKGMVVMAGKGNVANRKKKRHYVLIRRK